MGHPGYRGRLSENAVTLAEVLKSAGYRTFMSGKWHVGTNDPTRHGFEQYFGTLISAQTFWDPAQYLRLPQGSKTRSYDRDAFYGTDALTDYAVDFLEDARTTPDRPWFLYLAFHTGCDINDLSAAESDIVRAMSTRTRIFLCVLSLVFASTTHAEAPPPALDPDAVQKMLELIRTTPPNDFRGLVVIKDGKVVLEEYFNTYWQDTVHDIRSAGKSVTALLLGMAIDKGLVKNVDQSVGDLLGESKFARITIANLLTMSSGLDADDGDDKSPGNAEKWMSRDNWTAFAKTLPFRTEPGTKWVYSDVSPMLIGAIIEKQSGMKLADFARQNLFEPLGIREYYWYTGRGGSTGAAGNLYISTLDFAKIGQLVLDGGRWQGKQIVSESWTREMQKKRFDISGTNPFASGYGYFWWLGEKKIDEHTYSFSFASGNGGNVLFVVPEENMVVSLTSSAYGQGYGHQRAHNVFALVLKALRRQ